MKSYEVIVEDIYDKNKSKKVKLDAVNVYLAHKDGLKHANALREEISKIICKGKIVFTYSSGFSED